MWTAGKFRIRDEKDAEIMVTGIVDEVSIFGLSQVGGDIAVTHIPSGYRVGRLWTNMGQAMLFADCLRPLSDWGAVVPPGVTMLAVSLTRTRVLQELPL